MIREFIEVIHRVLIFLSTITVTKIISISFICISLTFTITFLFNKGLLINEAPACWHS